MAIEIIKHGEGGTKYIATCRECGCQFSFQEEDVEQQYFDRNELYVQIHCPECNCNMTLSRDNLPTKSV